MLKLNGLAYAWIGLTAWFLVDGMAAMTTGAPTPSPRNTSATLESPPPAHLLEGWRDDVSIAVWPDGNVCHCHRLRENGTAQPDRVNVRAVRRLEEPAGATGGRLQGALGSGVEPGDWWNIRILRGSRSRTSDRWRLAVGTAPKCGGRVVGVQKILPNGDKLYVKGTRKAGAYHTIGKPDERIVIAEGYATGATIHEATAGAVAVAFDTGNMIHVAKALRAKYPMTTIILAADGRRRDRRQSGPDRGDGSSAGRRGTCGRAGLRCGSTRRRDGL